MSFLQKVGRKFWTICFYGRLSLHGLLGFPAQTNKERQIFKAIFNRLADKKLRVFEWGSGFSTIYYAQYLRKKGPSFEWHAIDNNKLWHEKVARMVRNKGLNNCIYLYLREFLPFWKKLGWGVVPPPCGVFSPKDENELAYINFPKTLKNKFDVVIIDARFRRHCLEVARQVVASGGIVVLHDAQKPHYQVGLEKFPYQRFVHSGSWAPFQQASNTVWVGIIDHKKLFDSLSCF